MKRSSAELKALARKALIGNYGLCIAAYLLFGLFSIIIGFVSSWIFPVSFYSSGFTSAASYVFQFLILLLVQVLNVGFLQISLKISRHEQAQLQDLFHGFTHHPDRILAVALIWGVLSFLLVSLPMILFTQYGMTSLPFYQDFLYLPTHQLTFRNAFSFLGILLIVICVISFIGMLLYALITLPFAMTMFLLADTEYTAIEALKESARLMKGNKGRYFYIQYLSFLGIQSISLLSCGVALLWVQPYMNVTLANFYRELRGEI